MMLMASLTRFGRATGNGLRRYDAEDSVEGRKAEYDGGFALPLVYGKVGRTDDFRNNR